MSRLKIPKKIYCKYCYKKVSWSFMEDIIRCDCCGYGLAPIESVEKAGGWAKWQEQISKNFQSFQSS